MCVCLHKKRYTRTLTIYVLFHILFITIFNMLSSHIHTCANTLNDFGNRIETDYEGFMVSADFHCLCYVRFSFSTRVFQCNRCTTFMHIFPSECFFYRCCCLFCLFFLMLSTKRKWLHQSHKIMHHTLKAPYTPTSWKTFVVVTECGRNMKMRVVCIACATGAQQERSGMAIPELICFINRGCSR